MRAFRRILSLPFRALGYVFVIAAFAAGIRDTFLSVSQNRAVFTSLGELWFRISPESLNLAQAGIQRGLHPAIWDPGVLVFLRLPSLLGFFILAALTLLAAQLIYRPR